MTDDDDDTQKKDTIVFLVCMVGTAIAIGFAVGPALGIAYVFLVVMGITLLRLTRPR